MPSTSQDKGSFLERAVAAIETAILERNPELKGKKFTLECRKVIIADDVKHEIDVFVQIDRGDGYDSTFIFECKNLAENVGKNEIIVFSEKIRVTSASRGFFVAKGYGEYARAQAIKDPRVTLLDATEASSIIGGLKGLSVEVTLGSNLRFTLFQRNPSAIVTPLKNSAVIHSGERKTFDSFIKGITEDLTKQRTSKSDIHGLPAGEHTLQMIGDLSFKQNTLTVDARDIERIHFHLKVGYKRLFPKFKGGFEVSGRGRYLEFGSVEVVPGRTLEDISIVF